MQNMRLVVDGENLPKPRRYMDSAMTPSRLSGRHMGREECSGCFLVGAQ